MIGAMTDPESPAPTPTPRRPRAGTVTTGGMPAATSKPAKPKKSAARKRKPADPAKAWLRTLARTRPGLVPFVNDALAEMYGRPVWQRVHEATSELVLTILSQNSADVNAEQAFESLRRACPRTGTAADPEATVADPDVAAAPGTPLKINRPGWGGIGLDDATAPDWDAVERASIAELTDAIRPGGLANLKAPRIQAALRTIREQTGSHALEFLGDMPALDARAWLTAIDGIGRKTASVVLLFSFGTPLMPVDRHVERVSLRIGLIPPKATADEAHELYLAMLEPDQMHEAHVNLIQHGRRTCHARKPACDACAVAPRCRFIDRRAP